MSDTTVAPAPAHTLSFMIGDPKKADGRVSLVLNGKWRSFLLSSDQGTRLVELLRAQPQDIEAIGELADIQTWITKRSKGRVTVDDCERLRLDGKLIDYGLTGRIGAIIEQGVPFDSLANFIERLDRNPDATVKDDLYRFMEKGNLPLDPDGFVLGFKRVRSDYLSIHSGVEQVKVWEADAEEPTVMQGRLRYPVGGRLEMNREDCDPNRDRTCSRGLHVCSYEYLKFFGGDKLLIVRVDPEFVTAIPADHNDQKLRCCKLEVMAEIPEDEAKSHFTSIVDTRYPAKVVEPEAPPPLTDAELEEIAAADGPPADAYVTAEEAEDYGRTRLKLIPLEDEDSASVEVQWAKKGYDGGHEAGELDRTNEYDYNPDIEFPEDIPTEERPVFAKAFVEGYEVGYKTPADGDWSAEKVIAIATKVGADHAQSDYPAYDNTVLGDEWEALVAWVTTSFPDLVEPESHELVALFDRTARDSYHNAFNAIQDLGER